MDKDMKPELKADTSKKDLLVSLSAMLGAIGYTAGYALRFPEEKVSVTFKRWFDEQIANAKAGAVVQDGGYSVRCKDKKNAWSPWCNLGGGLVLENVEIKRVQQAETCASKKAPPWDGVFNSADFKTETYRAPGAASGFSPQLVSGVRVTHIPTGLFEACHDSRTTGDNKETAWQRLLSRLRGGEALPVLVDVLDSWRAKFSALVYDDLAAADNQDVPLEEYPDRILKVLDSIVGPRLDAFKHEVFNYPYALEKAEKYDRLQPYLCKTCSGYGAVGNILTAEPCPECTPPASVADTRDAERYRWLRNPRQDVSLVLDKVTGYTPIDKFGAGGYNHYEYRSGEDLDSAIDAAIAAQAAAQGEN